MNKSSAGKDINNTFGAQQPRSIYHNIEMSSKVYVDNKQAFDSVWQIGLMYKLFKLRIRDKIWCIINDKHYETFSAVIANQSTWRFSPCLKR